MRVIGTAGQVDHGKTALIKALSGIDADRLPEEKARKMTTDLGFAYYEDSMNGTVGIVDVPGHERYIRNMVAGIWGLDLVLLLVAADDGWMPQTTLHTQIAVSMAEPAIIIVLNKADLVSPSRLDELINETLLKAESIMGYKPEIFPVSSITGFGIQELKKGISQKLFDRAKRKNDGCLLYVDRSFASKGLGHIVAGTLAGGTIKIQDELMLFPKNEKAKVRSVESYKKGIAEAEAGSRVAMTLSGLKSPPTRGDLIVDSRQKVFYGKEFLIRFVNLPGSEFFSGTSGARQKYIKPGLEVELATGSAMSRGELWLYKNPYARILLAEDIACTPGAAAAILSRDGTKLLYRAYILNSGKTSAKERRLLSTALPKVEEILKEFEKSDNKGLIKAHEIFLFFFNVIIHNWARLPETLNIKDSLLLDLLNKANFTIIASEQIFVFDTARLNSLITRLTKLASEPTGITKAMATSIFEGDEDASKAVLSILVKQEKLEQSAAVFKLKGFAVKLNPEEEKLKTKLEAAGKEGLEPGKTTAQQDAKVLKTLCSSGLAVPLDGGIFLSKKIYDQLIGLVLKGKKLDDSFTVPEAKDRTGLSRKYIIPLLNRMEDHGYVKRVEDVRIVKKLLKN